jgi:hypothetical protein
MMILGKHVVQHSVVCMDVEYATYMYIAFPA